MQTGKETIVIPEVTNNEMGVQISHIINGCNEDFKCGNGARLNLHETLIKGENGYIYTDSLGEEHTVTESFYYIDENGEKRVVEKTDVVIDSDYLMYSMSTFKPVVREMKTDNGLKVATTLENIDGAEYVEQRTTEVKELEEKIYSYEQAICNFKVYNIESNTEYAITEIKNSFPIFIKRDGFVMTDADILSYKGLLAQKKSLQNSIEKYLPVSKEALELQRNALTVENDSDYYYRYDNYSDQMDNIDIQDEEADNQIILVDNQIQLLCDKSEQYKEQLTKYYVEYLSLLEQLKMLKLQSPESFIVGDNEVKGFNANGHLVVMYKNDGKYIAIEYEYNETKTSTRISRVYDEKEREIKLSYDKATGLLVEIRNSNGEKVRFGYYLNENWSVYILNQVIFPNEKALELETSKFTYANDFSNIVRDDEYKVTKIENRTYTNSTSHNNIETTTTSKTVSEYTITYNELATTVTDDLSNECIYTFNENGQVVEYIEISNSFVRNAIKYEYTGDHLTKIIYPTHSCLNVLYDSFAFVEDYSKTVAYDDFEKITSETIGWVTISDAVKKQSVITYTYDVNDRPVKLYTVVSTKNSGTILSETENSVQLFEYNKNGQLLCEKSYKEGEELTEGISIVEHIYNENGFEIKTVLYNSLDPSSKLYKECEVNEDGQIVAELDQSGMYKTAYDGNTAIQPNGARLSYGYSKKDENSAVTMSTENGEENSTQKLYTNGLLTRIISGDDVYDYTYDHKGRVTNVKINGESYVDYMYNESGETTTVTSTFTDGHKETTISSPYGEDKTITKNNEELLVNVSYNKRKVASKILVENNVLNSKTQYTYNEQGDLVKAAVSKYEDVGFTEIYSENYTYNDYGNLTQRLISFSQARTDTTTYEYDESTQKLAAINCAGATRIETNTDCLGRNRGKTVSWNGEKIYSEDITYLKQGDHATTLPLTISYGRKINDNFVIKENIKYKYDNMGNITKVYENGELVTEYKYDALNRLVRENNKALNKTYVFLYDNKGNILARKEYPFTLKGNEYLEELTALNTDYEYSNGKLTSFDNEEIEYDVLGNPTSYRGNTLSWRFGKRLMSYGTNTFDYDAEGKRTKKNSITYSYDVDGRLITESSDIEYFYDTNSTPLAFAYLGELYYYKKDLLGNIIEILDMAGTTMVKYTYDAWGNHTITDNSGFGLGNINPIRYRGYYYDTDVSRNCVPEKIKEIAADIRGANSK